MRYVWILIMSFMMLAACAKSATEPADTDSMDTIVFQSGRTGNTEIYSMNADGSNQVNLTNNSAQDRRASSSPDGTQIVFSSNRDGNYEIYVMDANGSNPSRLTNNASGDTDPSWSPDGTKIVFVASRDGSSEIYTMDADGSNQTRLTTTGQTSSPSWRGSFIYYARYDGVESNNIWRMTDTGSGNVQIIADALNLSLSPDGTKIAFERVTDNTDLSSATEVYTCNSDGSTVVRLTNSTDEDGEAAWSPDGNSIVFMTCRSGMSTYNIAVMTATGASQTVITTTNNELRPSFVGQPR